MQKPKDYDQAQKYEGGQSLPAGGYVCRIENVVEGMSRNGRQMLTVALDIAEGEFTGMYRKAFDRQDPKFKKWKCNSYVLCYGDKGETHRQFKTFVEDVRESNQGWEPQWGDNFAAHFRGALVGAVFGREQFEGQDGKAYWNTKPKFFKTVEEIRGGDFDVPKDKPLHDDSGYLGYQAQPQGQVQSFEGFAEVSDDDVPFA